MDWQAILTGLIAGGFGGQLVTLFLTEKSASRRELRQWLREERFRTFADLIELVSATAPRDDYDSWPTKIRVQCQKAQLLFPAGKVPEDLVKSMENVFQMARAKKHGEVQDHDKWTQNLRDEARSLRDGLAKALHNVSR
jgi:hypothetical protein